MSCASCGMPKDLKEFLASLIKVDGSGNYGLNINLIGVLDCGALTDATSCGQPQTLEELIAKSCSLDTCGNVRINVFYESTPN